MNLLATEKITWTVPTSAKARRLFREWKSLPEDAEVRRQELAAKLPQVEQYRLTLSSVTMTEEAKRENLLQSVRQWFEEKHGVGPAHFNMWYLDTYIYRKDTTKYAYDRAGEITADEATAIFGVVRDLADWATFLVCLKSVEKRAKPMAEDDSTQPWAEIGIPAEWKDYHAFREVFPRKLFNEAVAICNDLNPGVWGVAMDEDSKNVGGVSVTS